MRTPSMNDLSVHSLCNLPASVKRLPRRAQPAIGQAKRSRFSDVIDESPNLTDAAVCCIEVSMTSLFVDAKIRTLCRSCKHRGG